jgi:2-dehydro-3-deoxygalactonokinase
LALFERMDAAALTSYLSGLLIGEELRDQPLAPGQQVVLIGSGALTQRYALALAQRGVACSSFGAEATWSGLYALSQVLESSAVRTARR